MTAHTAPHPDARCTPPPSPAPTGQPPAAAPDAPPTMPREFAERMPDGRLLYSDEPQMETTFHARQLSLLTTTLEWHWRDREDFFIGANLSVYYDRSELRRRRFLGPDFFLVRGVSNAMRRSWVVWEEGGRYPDLIVELLSDSTARMDRGGKRTLYQDIFRTPEYVWYDPIDREFVALRLAANRRYEPIPTTPEGLCWSEVLEMYLGVADGWLRYFDAEGRLIPTAPESALAEHARAETERVRAEAERVRAEAERERAEAERERADRERQRAEALAARLRALGVDPNGG